VSPILVIKMAALFVRLISYTVNFMGGWELNNLEGNQIRLGCTSPLLLSGASITYADGGNRGRGKKGGRKGGGRDHGEGERGQKEGGRHQRDMGSEYERQRRCRGEFKGEGKC